MLHLLLFARLSFLVTAFCNSCWQEPVWGQHQSCKPQTRWTLRHRWKTQRMECLWQLLLAERYLSFKETHTGPWCRSWPPCSSATVNTKLPVSPCQLAEGKEYKDLWKERKRLLLPFHWQETSRTWPVQEATCSPPKCPLSLGIRFSKHIANALLWSYFNHLYWPLDLFWCSALNWKEWNVCRKNTPKSIENHSPLKRSLQFILEIKSNLIDPHCTPKQAHCKFPDFDSIDFILDITYGPKFSITSAAPFTGRSPSASLFPSSLFSISSCLHRLHSLNEVFGSLWNHHS